MKHLDLQYLLKCIPLYIIWHCCIIEEKTCSLLRLFSTIRQLYKGHQSFHKHYFHSVGYSCIYSLQDTAMSPCLALATLNVASVLIQVRKQLLPSSGHSSCSKCIIQVRKQWLPSTGHSECDKCTHCERTLLQTAQGGHLYLLDCCHCQSSQFRSAMTQGDPKNDSGTFLRLAEISATVPTRIKIDLF